MKQQGSTLSTVSSTSGKAADDQSRFILRLIEALSGELAGAPLSLLRDGNVVASVGTMGEKQTRFPLQEFELAVGIPPEDITTLDRASVMSAATLMRSLLPQIKDGRIGLSDLFRSSIHLLKSLEGRSAYLDHYEKILHLNQRILMAGELQQVLQIIMDQAKDGAGGEAASLLLVDPRTSEMYFNVVSGFKGTELSEIRIPAGQGIAGSVVLKGKAEIIQDVASDPRTYTKVDQVLNQTTRSMIVCPIPARGQIIGVIEVINSTSGQGFTADNLEFLTNIASHTGLLIENARNLQDLVRSNRLLDRKISEINGLYEIGNAVATTLDATEFKKLLLRNLLKVLRVGTGSILEIDSVKRTAREVYKLSISDKGIDEVGDYVTYNEVKDILVWMRENREPLYFGTLPGADTEGLSNRFRRDNATLLQTVPGPDLWLPALGGDDMGVAFVLSMGDVTLRRRNPVDDLAFYRGVMTLAEAGYRNVQLYAGAISARSKEEHIRKVFQKYVPARVVQEVVEQTEAPKPRQQIVSVLFADIRNFTRIVETVEPSLVVELLNEFFEEMVEVVTHRNGIVDKFMGDSLMALFGVPHAEPDDAQNAVLAARDMMSRLQAMNRRRMIAHRPLFEAGIGIHTGPAVVGNVGASQRMDYTAVGDSVNLAARLEKLTRYYRTAVLLSEDTIKAAGMENSSREIDLIQVRGRVQSTRVFELVSDEQAAHQEDWKTALAEYRAANFREALPLFERLADFGDPLGLIYQERCRTYMAVPPGAEWAGVFKLDL